jgi:hypothetical protein
LTGLVGLGSFGNNTESVVFRRPQADVRIDFTSRKSDGVGISAVKVIVNNTKLIGITNATKFIDRDFQDQSTTTLYVQFRNISERQNISTPNLLHIGNLELKGFSPPLNLSFHFGEKNITYEFNETGFLILGTSGNATIEVIPQGTPIMHDDNDRVFKLGSGENWFPSAFALPFPNPTSTDTLSLTDSPTVFVPADLSTGTIVGIVIGSVSIPIVVIVVVVLCVRKRRSQVTSTRLLSEHVYTDSVENVH